MELQRGRILVILSCTLCVSPTTQAAEVTIPDEYGRHIQQRSELASGDGVFGDRIDLGSGRLEIVQTDVDLPGNNGLSVRVGRRFVTGGPYSSNGHFYYWDLDLAHVHGTFPKAGGWQVTSTASNNRCSQFSAPRDVYFQGGWFSPDEFWSGSFVYLPGSGDQELLQRGNAHVPSDGQVYPAVTREGAAVRCVALATTSESGSWGEGFEVVTPDGVVHTFNHMVTRIQSSLRKSNPFPQTLTVGAESVDDPEPNIAVNYILPRKEVIIFPTRVKDRFGNTVTYTWSATNPWQLLRISASDGRQLDFTYQDANSALVTAVSDGSRTWRYAYAPPRGIDTVTLPDGSSWRYALGDLALADPRPDNVACDVMTKPTSPWVGSVTAPSGAKAEFTLTPVLQGRSWVFRQCIDMVGDTPWVSDPYLFLSLATTRRKITGPGLPAAGLSWTYAYGPPNNCWNPGGVPSSSSAFACTSSSPTTRTVSVTAPDSSTTRYTYGNRYRVDEGLLLKTDYGWNGSSALRTEAITYADPSSAPYAAFNGNTVRSNGDYDITSLVRPRRQVTVTQQGRTFTWQVAATCAGMPYCFDAYARPTKVAKTGAP